MCVLYVVLGLRYDPEPLGVLPWVVLCCLFVRSRYCSYILQGPCLYVWM